MSWNKGSLDLENGSRVVASSTSSSAVRGGSYNMIFLDEFAFVPTNVAEDFFSSVYPTISSGKSTKVIIVSTPNGMNLFYKLWVDAENQRNSYNIIDVHWSEVPGLVTKSGDRKLLQTPQRNSSGESLNVSSWVLLTHLLHLQKSNQWHSMTLFSRMLVWICTRNQKKVQPM